MGTLFGTAIATRGSISTRSFKSLAVQ